MTHSIDEHVSVDQGHLSYFLPSIPRPKGIVPHLATISQRQLLAKFLDYIPRQLSFQPESPKFAKYFPSHSAKRARPSAHWARFLRRLLRARKPSPKRRIKIKGRARLRVRRPLPSTPFQSRFILLSTSPWILYIHSPREILYFHLFGQTAPPPPINPPTGHRAHFHSRVPRGTPLASAPRGTSPSRAFHSTLSSSAYHGTLSTSAPRGTQPSSAYHGTSSSPYATLGISSYHAPQGTFTIGPILPCAPTGTSSSGASPSTFSGATLGTSSSRAPQGISTIGSSGASPGTSSSGATLGTSPLIAPSGIFPPGAPRGTSDSSAPTRAFLPLVPRGISNSTALTTRGITLFLPPKPLELKNSLINLPHRFNQGINPFSHCFRGFSPHQ